MQPLETLAALFDAVSSIAEMVNGLSGLLWLAIGGTNGTGFLSRQRRLRRAQSSESDTHQASAQEHPAA